ncbi:acyltransferase family protein [Thermoanaerobacterium sp. RBIITD]|uniref:acyltransferase family protein n=1 Tax=Thermoanaerobacterium sp. RBIITD TaxID=1550240 RepID=UPI000BB91C85|nr:acyltransferase family protein [Thermoanaerobacterium sp. RBIITD]SNX54741.1 Peptidoglycan/LPS O-acetylase OafA/YrhL, contains acyltransferase and SGNH-hydrolase domains [Thermoanaerobacterium sp. RBIITD]
MPKPLNSNSRYMAGLDGLRAIAVLAVIGYHLNLSFMQGGFLGVSIFFVLSGYLITNLLTVEWEKSNKIDLKNFWIRRARRLFPALFIMIVLVVSWVTLFDSERLSSIKGDALTSILYINNWWLIFHKVSYFAKFGPPSTFGNLWSLAVEGQFYVVWPFLFIIGFRYIKKKTTILWTTIFLAIASAIEMALIYQPGLDPSRVYYGTDTRAFGLLIGSTLALIWPSGKLSNNISKHAILAIDVIGSISLLSIFIMFVVINQYDTFLYRGGMFILSIAAAITIAAVAHPASRLGKVLGCLPLRWLGARSYGVYLWYFPILILTSPLVNTNGINVVHAIIQVVFIILIAAISWKYIEDPIRHGALKNIWHQLMSLKQNKKRWTLLPIKTWVIMLTAVFTIGVFIIGMTGIAPTAATTSALGKGKTIHINQSNTSSVASKNIDENTAHTVPSLPDNKRDVKVNPYNGGKTDSQNNNGGNNESINVIEGKQEVKAQDGKGITVIGDSILIDTEPYLKELLPGIVIDGKVGRQLYQAVDVVKNLKAKGELGNTLIIELGTNGPFTEDQLLSLLKSAEPVKQIILVNVRVPRPWESIVNATLSKVASKYPHTAIVDWYSASAGHDSFFSKDAVHLQPSGARYFASLIVKTINENK